MNLLERLNNIYVIDTKMWDFDHYMSAYIVEGKEIALIDTGEPNHPELLFDSIQAHGFSVSDISYIFVTHCEHADHAGNVAPLLKASPKAKVYINPVGREYLTNPSIEDARRKKRMPLEMLEKRAKMQAVPESRIKYLNDGDEFDLGNGEKLKVIFAPGHQPSGIVILEEKNQGLFINDLVGNCFMDANVQYPLNPPGSDHKQAIESLRKLVDLPVANLYLGHYGICDRPKQVMIRAIDFMQNLLDMGSRYISEGKPELIPDKVHEMILLELEKLRAVRGESLYRYASLEHVPYQAKIFAQYCVERLSK